jgi:hypothetical protein
MEHPLEQERRDLCAIAQAMTELVPSLAPRLKAWRDHLADGLGAAHAPLAAESVLEEAVRALRHVWLEAAASSTSRTYRSPAEDENTVTPAGRFHNFGYERDLQPVSLEERCARFFPPPPRGWTSKHVLFSSGQAAMNAVLTLLSSAAPLRLSYQGCYFETAELLALYKSRFVPAPSEEAEILIAEPVWCDGARFGTTPPQWVAALANRAHAKAIVIDSTLAGLDDGLNGLLSALARPLPVFRLHSGLKLFEGGLELADVGIVSVHGPAGHDPMQADELRRIRTLHGAGLSFADVAALELPLFLDPAATRSYEDAIFRNNAALADAARSNPAFAVAYPSGSSPMGRAPYVIFNLTAPSLYDGLDEKVGREAARRGLSFTRGGSFGFRGHRFETVRPEGKPPFLRVAMGKREGPSARGICEFFREFSP